MLTVVLLALTPTTGDAPACLLPGAELHPDAGRVAGAEVGDVPGAEPGTELHPDAGQVASQPGTSVLGELLDQLAHAEQRVVVTWHRWAGQVAAAAAGRATVVAVDALATAVQRALGLPGAAGVPATGDLVVLPAHLVANDLGLGRLTDAGARGTATLVRPASGGPVGAAMPVREVRGRVVAAGSALHRLEQPSHLGVGVLRIAAGDRERFVPLAEELTGLLASQSEVEETGEVEEADEVEGTGEVHDAAIGLWRALPATTDLVALLLVTAVRGGVPVAATALPPGLVWALPTSAAEVAEARRARGDVDEERVRLDAAVKAEDGFFTTFFVSTYSRYWARWAARRGFTPDQVTVVSMLLGVVAAVGFAWGTTPGALLGAVALQVAFTLDCVDGQLARYTRRFTLHGAWLDSVFDRAKEYVVYAGLAIGGIRAGDDATLWALAAATLALQTFRHTLDLGYAEQQRADVAREVVRPLTAAVTAPTFWEAVPAASSAAASGAVETATPEPATVGTPTPGTSTVGLPQRIIAALRRAEAIPVLKWAKRIVVLPIGERFALISVLAVFGTPRLVFGVLLGWGALAAAYTAGGRLVRSVA